MMYMYHSICFTLQVHVYTLLCSLPNNPHKHTYLEIQTVIYFANKNDGAEDDF